MLKYSSTNNYISTTVHVQQMTLIKQDMSGDECLLLYLFTSVTRCMSITNRGSLAMRLLLCSYDFCLAVAITNNYIYGIVCGLYSSNVFMYMSECVPWSQVGSYCSVRITWRSPRLRKKAESRLMKSDVIPAYSSPSAISHTHIHRD